MKNVIFAIALLLFSSITFADGPTDTPSTNYSDAELYQLGYELGVSLKQRACNGDFSAIADYNNTINETSFPARYKSGVTNGYNYTGCNTGGNTGTNSGGNGGLNSGSNNGPKNKPDLPIIK